MIQTTDEFLAHYGVKGMKWGVRKDEETGGDDKLRFQGPATRGGVSIDPDLHEDTQDSAAEVASLISERYGFNITEVKSFGPGHPEYEMGTLGYVQLGSGNANEGTIFASQGDLQPRLEHSVDIGWTKPATEEIQSFLTHESAHAIFHAQVKTVKAGMFGGTKQVGGHIEARNVALGVALREAGNMGITMPNFMPSISGYASAAGIREEAEAEMFAQYHWGQNTPKFIKAWGESLHNEMGLDPTPFKEMR